MMIELIQSDQYGVILKVPDADLADQIDDFLSERYVLFEVRRCEVGQEFLFGQAGAIEKISALLAPFMKEGDKAASDSDFGKRYGTLGRSLEKCRKVTQYDDDENKEAWRLAHGLLDIEESALVISQRLLPALVNPTLTEVELEDLLFDVGEQLRHILYHIRDNHYYGYVREQVEAMDW